ncbi:MAG: hypothetical protein FJ298_06360 [Planctomycetes bacterium]|nr:hypothetical protein [Planctomycetota bacterium]
MLLEAVGAVLAASSWWRCQTTVEVQVDARVVDVSGHTVAEAEFADSWTLSEGRWRGSMTCGASGHRQPLRSDAQGRLRGVWIESPFNEPLLGYSADRRLVAFAFASVHPTTRESYLRGDIVLAPAVSVEGRLRTTVEPPPRALAVRVFRAHPERPASLHGISMQVEAPNFSLPLPSGTCQWTFRYGYGTAERRTLLVPAGRDAFDIGPVTVPPKPLDLIGELLPDWPSDLGAESPPDQISAAKFRGRPLLLAFDEWGGPIVAGSRVRPALAALASHARRSEFAVVLYDTSMRPPEQRTGVVPQAPVVEELFPIFHPPPYSDANALYGTRWAIAVLDADGRLVHCGREVADAVAALETLLR